MVTKKLSVREVNFQRRLKSEKLDNEYELKGFHFNVLYD